MSRRQTTIVSTVIAGALLLSMLALLAGFRQPAASPSPAQPGFDASRALDEMEAFVTECPDRVFGTFQSRHAMGYLSDRLREMGYAVDYTQYSARIGRTKEVGRNVLGYREGANPEILALTAHYDTAATTVQGAMANGSGVGVLLEIARILADRPPSRSLLVVCTDGGEWGMLGAVDLATRYSERGRIAAVLSLDYVGIGELAALRLDTTGLRRGYTPPWYRMLSLGAAQQEGIPVRSPEGFGEHLARTLYIPWSDQGPFLGAGIPAVNLGSTSVDLKKERAIYHSPQDTAGNLTPMAMGQFGRTAERIVRTLDALPSIPRQPDAFRVRKDRFLGAHTIRVLHGILFLPLLFCFFFHVRNHRHGLGPMRLGRELIAWLATVLPMAAWYLMIGLFRKLRMLPFYDLYPATAKDPVLQNPSWGVIGGILGVAVLIAALCTLLFVVAYRRHPGPSYSTSKTVLLGLALPIVVLALAYNSYWAATMLALPCWIWCLAGGGSGWNARLRHWAWILAGAIPCCMVAADFASRFGMGPNAVWYQILALNTGLFSAAGFFLGIAAAAIGVRFLVGQLHACP